MAFAPRMARVLARQPSALEALINPGINVNDTGLFVLSPVEISRTLEQTMDVARRHHREAALHIAIGIVKGALEGQAAGAAFTRVADEIITVMCDAVWAEARQKILDVPGAAALIVLGKAGSREMTAASDLDLIMVYSSVASDGRPAPRSERDDLLFRRFTRRLVTALSAPTNEGELYKVDMRLRPSGTAGPVAVTLPRFDSYYKLEAETWELLALTRARVIWATDTEFQLLTERAVNSLLLCPREISRLSHETRLMNLLLNKTHIPRSHIWDFKFSQGGLVEIEFAAQFIQLINAPRGKPILSNTLEALNTFAELTPSDRPRLARLARAWQVQQNLAQFLAVVLELDDDDPERQAPGFLELLARRGGASSIEDLRRDLGTIRTGAHRDCQAIIGG